MGRGSVALLAVVGLFGMAALYAEAATPEVEALVADRETLVDAIADDAKQRYENRCDTDVRTCDTCSHDMCRADRK